MARFLTIEELWASWPMEKNPDRELWKYKGNICSSLGASQKMQVIPTMTCRVKDKHVYPSQRTDYDVTDPIRLEWRQERRREKLNVVTVVVVSFAPRDGSYIPWPGLQHDVFSKLWEEAHLDNHESLTVSQKVELAVAMKEEANCTFRRGDWKTAWHEYGRAWMQLLPYHIDAFPAGSEERNSLAEIENVIFGNMMSCAIACDRDKTMKFEDKRASYSIGITAGQLLVEQRFGSTVKQLNKALIQLKELYKRQATLIADQRMYAVETSENHHKWLNNELHQIFRSRRDHDHKLHEEDYKLEIGLQTYSVLESICDRYPDEQTVASSDIIPIQY